MKALLTILSGILFASFLILFAGIIMSGCGGCGYGDEHCYTYDDGETICYDQPACDDEDY